MNVKRLSYCALMLCLGMHSRADATTPITDADWTALNANENPGPDNVVRNLIYNDGKLFMVGDFRKVGDSTLSGIVVWDGNSFRSIGTVAYKAMAVGKDGTVYAGTYQDTTGGRQPYIVQKWDGSNWTSLGSGFNGSFNDIEAGSDGSVYVAGEFTNAGGVPANYLAKWDGKGWKAVNWPGGNTINDVYVSPKGAVYVGGNFSGGIAKQVDTTWQVINGLDADRQLGAFHYLDVKSIIADKDENLFVSGTIDFIKGKPAKNIAKWNGSSWENMDGGLTGVIYKMTMDGNGKLYAGGTDGILSQWDGDKWNRIGYGTSRFAMIYTLACDEKGTVYIGGSFTEFNRIGFWNLAAWDGTNWFSPVRNINSVIWALTSDSKGNVYAGGYFTLAGGIAANRIAKWDGKQWSALGSGLTNDRYENDAVVFSLASDDSDNIYVGGEFTKAGGIPARNIARWNGTRWDSLGKGTNNRVYRITHDRRGTLYATGGFDSAGDFSVPGIARWNNGDWYPVQAGRNGTDRVTAITADKQGNVYAAGQFFNGSRWNTNIGLWKNDEWKVMSTGLSDFANVSSMVSDNRGNLYVGGEFQSIEGAGVNVARWNGNKWNSLGNGLPVIPRDVALAADSHGNIYATGDWEERQSGVLEKQLGKWNGASWEPLGSGVDDAPLDMICIDSTLYISGSFVTTGKKHSPHFAKVNVHSSEVSTSIPARTTRASAVPEWKVLHSTLILSHVEPADRVRIYAPNGRLMLQRTGGQIINLASLPRHPLMLDITRNGQSILRDKIERQ